MFTLAVSNIAWDVSQDDAVAEILRQHGISSIEIAPTKYWPQPLQATPTEIAAIRATWAERGFSIVALQALLFGQPQLQLLQSPEQMRECINYLAGIIRLGTALGAKSFVFGSPKNRDASQLTPEVVQARANAAWTELAAVAAQTNTIFCLEPNPEVYACNFMTLTPQAFEFADAFKLPGLGINLDTGIMLLNQEDPRVIIPQVISTVGHVHLSEPHLAPVAQATVDHALISHLLREQDYRGSISVEMRGAAEPAQNLENVRAACELLNKYYRD
jgi:D-psicose/D-tagatose/L-ribulose 3-epimerase